MKKQGIVGSSLFTNWDGDEIKVQGGGLVLEGRSRRGDSEMVKRGILNKYSQ